ncbi:MAG TPA: hypothetical protein PK450_05685 [Paracoccaceae bacterium]|nr:hypothetical protein [Paracoccaceae bacterium]
MIRALGLAAVLAWPIAAGAEGPISTAMAFDAATRGRTFYYTRDGQPYGAEQYLPGQRVVWAFTGDDCQRGYWFENAGAICFVYDDAPDAPQCWTFRQTGAGLEGKVVGDNETSPLIARQSSPEPMACMGPDVGV